MFKVYNNVHCEITINHFSNKSNIYPINNFNIYSSKLNICSHCLIIICPYLWNSLYNSLKKNQFYLYSKKLKLSLISKID